MAPHVNPLGVTINTNYLPLFTAQSLVQLKHTLEKNELARSNKAKEPCQCPVILDVCAGVKKKRRNSGGNGTNGTNASGEQYSSDNSNSYVVLG